jgi:3-deoxy-D-manno-octulosonic-acid transferase
LWAALAAPLAPALWGYTQYRRRVQKKSAASVRGMWGHVPPASRRALHAPAGSQKHENRAPVLWIHAVSVGEVAAARVLARALRQVLAEREQAARVFLSVTTDTGMEAARGALAAGEADAVGFYPLDTPHAVRRALAAVRPRVFCSIETELWPLFLSHARACGVRLFLANGRVSDRLARDGARFGWFFRRVLGVFDALLMRSQADAERVRILAGPGANIIVAGDVKLDAVSQSDTEPSRARWREVLGLGAGELLWVAGSTHAGEEEAALGAHQYLRGEFPTLRLLLAPRHIERVPQVLALARAAGVPAVLRSHLGTVGCEAGGVIVLDTVGELAEAYGAGDAAFVGGSLIERGGHNVLEPVLRGAPVAFGPHTANFRAAVALVAEHSLGALVQDEAELGAAVAGWLREATLSDSARAEFAARVGEAMRPHQGASRRVAQVLADALASGSSAVLSEAAALLLLQSAST